MTIGWDVEDAHEVFIDNGIGKVASSGRLEFVPNDQRYTLTAYSFFGAESNAQITLEILGMPKLISEDIEIPPMPKLISEDIKLPPMPKKYF